MRWTEDPAFRAQVRRDPVEALRANGVQLGDDEAALLAELDFGTVDDVVDEAIRTRSGNRLVGSPVPGIATC